MFSSVFRLTIKYSDGVVVKVRTNCNGWNGGQRRKFLRHRSEMTCFSLFLRAVVIGIVTNINTTPGIYNMHLFANVHTPITTFSRQLPHGEVLAFRDPALATHTQCQSSAQSHLSHSITPTVIPRALLVDMIPTVSFTRRLHFAAGSSPRFIVPKHRGS